MCHRNFTSFVQLNAAGFFEFDSVEYAHVDIKFGCDLVVSSWHESVLRPCNWPDEVYHFMRWRTEACDRKRSKWRDK